MNQAIQKELGVLDSTCIIVGIIIGAGIYETAPTVAAAAGSGIAALGIWLAGGVLALCGALCYAELATAYPHQGGDYIYLTRAYGRGTGYLFGWSQLMIIRPGDIALMAFIFGRYALQISPVELSPRIWAVAVIIILTSINILGVRQGKWTQNILTVIKAAGILFIIAAALFAPSSSSGSAPQPVNAAGIQLAFILVLFTYGGWNEMAYVAAEVRSPEKNILRALLAGTCGVMLLYLLINAAFLGALGYKGLIESQAVAVDTIASAFPQTADRIIAVLICISALGAVNGLIFTGSRITYAVGRDHSLFNFFGKWHQKFSTPARALMLQGAIAIVIVLAAGSFIDTILYTAPAVWLFFFGTGLSVFLLRRKEPDTLRPYRITAFPLPAVLFCLFSLFMFYSSLTYAFKVKPFGLIILAVSIFAGIFSYIAAKNLKRT